MHCFALHGMVWSGLAMLCHMGRVSSFLNSNQGVYRYVETRLYHLGIEDHLLETSGKQDTFHILGMGNTSKVGIEFLVIMGGS